jgi:hypothetical protein
MKITGFSFVRNAFMLDYPVIQSLQSLAGICDSIVLALGESQDDTRQRIEQANIPGLLIIPTVWDDTLRTGGHILAQQTDIALRESSGDWLLYLQADEVLHQDDYPLILQAIENAPAQAEALLFRYLHFFGSYQFTGVGRQWYRREIRALRNTGKPFSWGDAQGFRAREKDGSIRKLRAIQTEARIFHYGWVRHPAAMQKKQIAFHKLYHDDDWVKANIPDSLDFPRCHEVAPYHGTHPAWMKEKIEQDAVWTSRFDPTLSLPRKTAVLLSDWIEKKTGIRLGEYKNFIELK